MRTLLACAALAWAGSCSGRPSAADGSAPVGYTKIDDMEGDGSALAWIPPSGLTAGSWYTATECGATGDIWPPPLMDNAGVLTPSLWSYSALAAPHETFPGILSTQAARLRTTSPLMGVWGAVMGLELASQPGLTLELAPNGRVDGGSPGVGEAACPQILVTEASVDLSAYSGVTFWAKGDLAGVRTVQVEFQDVHTDPRGGVCSTDFNSPDYCYNGFTTTIALTDTFSRYTIDFASLQQDPKWGYHPIPDVLDVQHVYQLQFQITTPRCYPNFMCVGGAAPPVSFDFWIDDLYFVNR